MADLDHRSVLFSRIRQGLGVRGDEPARRRAVDDRLSQHARNLVPQRGQRERPARIALFRTMAEGVQATVAEAQGPAEIPALIAAYLRQQNLPSRIRHGDDRMLSELPWREGAPTVERLSGRAEPADEVSVSRAAAGVAESGTLILLSGPDNPTTLNFLPETHIAIVRGDDIVGSYEDVFDRVRDAYGAGQMPRTLNMITGPSRTADIEQRLELGAHGPKRLHIIIVNNSPEPEPTGGHP
jgi:L-lactate dehydrogenase complex protein LldG